MKVNVVVMSVLLLLCSSAYSQYVSEVRPEDPLKGFPVNHDSPITSGSITVMRIGNNYYDFAAVKGAKKLSIVSNSYSKKQNKVVPTLHAAYCPRLLGERDVVPVDASDYEKSKISDALPKTMCDVCLKIEKNDKGVTLTSRDIKELYPYRKAILLTTHEDANGNLVEKYSEPFTIDAKVYSDYQERVDFWNSFMHYKRHHSDLKNLAFSRGDYKGASIHKEKESYYERKLFWVDSDECALYIESQKELARRKIETANRKRAYQRSDEKLLKDIFYRSFEEGFRGQANKDGISKHEQDEFMDAFREGYYGTKTF